MASINERIDSLCKSGKHADVVFLFKNDDGGIERVKGHRVLFAESSEVFEAMLYGELAEKDEIIMEDIKVEAFRSLKRFVYSDQVEFETVTHALDVFSLAHRYDLQLLLKKAEDYISTNLNASNVLRVFEFSRLYQRKLLEFRCFHFMRYNTLDVINSDDFLKCDVDLLDMFVNEEKLNVEEIDLFSGIDKWAEYNSNNEDSCVDVCLLNEVINKVRFLSMTAEEFARGPSKSSLLTIDERFHLLNNIIAPSSVPLPVRFSIERSPRNYKSSVSSVSSGSHAYNDFSSQQIDNRTTQVIWLMRRLSTTLTLCKKLYSSSFRINRHMFTLYSRTAQFNVVDNMLSVYIFNGDCINCTVDFQLKLLRKKGNPLIQDLTLKIHQHRLEYCIWRIAFSTLVNEGYLCEDRDSIMMEVEFRETK